MTLINPKNTAAKQYERRRQLHLIDTVNVHAIPKFRREFNRVAKLASSTWRKTNDTTSVINSLHNHLDHVSDILKSIYRIIINRSAEDVENQMGEKSLISYEKKNTDTLINSFIVAYSLSKAVSISDTTTDIIKKILAADVIEGLSEQVIAKKIVESTGGAVGLLRARTIVRTEAHQATQYAISQTIANSPIRNPKKEWVPALQPNTRSSHRAMYDSIAGQGQIRNMDEPFDVGGSALMYPGDPSGPAKEVINCRCVLVYHS